MLKEIPVPFPATPSSSGTGKAASSFRNRAGRYLFRPFSEPERLMLVACTRSAVAAMFASMAAISFAERWGPFHPLLPMVLIGTAVGMALRVNLHLSDLDAYERRTAKTISAVVDGFERQIAALNRQLAQQKFQNIGEREGSCAPVHAGKAADWNDSQSVAGNDNPLHPKIRL